MAKPPSTRRPKRTGIRARAQISVADAVRAALQRAAGAPPLDATASKLDHVADALVTKACAGDVQAIKAVFERLDGKTKNDAAGDEPDEVVIVHTFKSDI